MYIKNVKGAILFGIVITWVLGMLCQAAGIYVPDAEAGFIPYTRRSDLPI